MGPVIDVSDNVIIQDWFREATQKGLQAGLQKGLQQGVRTGKQETVRAMSKTKFRRWPKWAEQRLLSATPAQLDRFAKKLLTAETLEGVLGPRKLEL